MQQIEKSIITIKSRQFVDLISWQGLQDDYRTYVWSSMFLLYERPKHDKDYIEFLNG